MGIRFYCPNGHKMNVKDFQAGQKGFCPVCGEKVQIPLESTRTSSRVKQKTQAEAVSVEATVESAQENRPSSAALVFDASPSANPLADPNAVWYVHTPAGEQLGPVLPPVVQNWLREGKVTAECLVWREGWAEWQMAGAVFPQLQLSSSVSMSLPLEIISSVPASPAPHGHTHGSHIPPQKTQITILGVLTALIAILVIAFFAIRLTH